MTDFLDVAKFHDKFGLPTPKDGPPTESNGDVRDFRLKFLLEEVKELAEGYGYKLEWQLTPVPEAVPDLPAIADALIDLSYVTLGTANIHRLPWVKLWEEVQRTNMQKIRASSDGSNSRRKSGLDVVKPEGWEPPNLAKILVAFGWSGPLLPL